ncbi:MAG TPA: hypothetical protein VNN08_00020 [Thermoanaerobaculia bacterium]|nr:hypothetical protein [Thermoanaerobaculia bacterium]
MNGGAAYSRVFGLDLDISFGFKSDSLPEVLVNLILIGDCFVERSVGFPGPRNVIKISPLPRSARDADTFRKCLDRHIVQAFTCSTRAFAQRDVNRGRDASDGVLHT